MFVSSLFGYGQERYTDRYKNNSIRSEGLLHDGVKEGEWKYYYPSGELMGKEMFKRGITGFRFLLS
jgi:antitoxin component YwqK of YwqJK toxin-antitoxin module